MTEGEFSKEYDVSRITVRKAIEVLVEEGILIKKQGIGTFVVTEADKRCIYFHGFTRRVAVRTARFPVADFYQQIFQKASRVDQKSESGRGRNGYQERVIPPFCDGHRQFWK